MHWGDPHRVEGERVHEKLLKQPSRVERQAGEKGQRGSHTANGYALSVSRITHRTIYTFCAVTIMTLKYYDVANMQRTCGVNALSSYTQPKAPERSWAQSRRR